MIPKALRDRARLQPGDLVDFELRGKEIVLVAQDSPARLGGRFSKTGMAARLRRGPSARASLSVCLDAWAILAWLDGEEPALSRVEEIIETQARRLSWVNLVEVYYRVERDHGQRRRQTRRSRTCERHCTPDLPGTARMIEAARLKARTAVALGDCFAVVTAAARGLVLLTGDREIIEMPDRPCQAEDLRAVTPIGRVRGSRRAPDEHAADLLAAQLQLCDRLAHARVARMRVVVEDDDGARRERVAPCGERGEHRLALVL